MAYDRPPLAKLISQAQADVQSRLPGSDPLLRHSVLGAIATTQAGGLHGLYGYQAHIAQQITPATATDYLETLASVWDIARQQPSPASGQADLSGNTGAAVSVGLRLQSSNGAQYETISSGTVDSGGQVSVSVRALDAGVEGNAAAGASLTFISPQADVDTKGYVGIGGLAGGSDLETDERLRQRLLQRIQAPPHGGNKADYEAWALDVTGVSDVWVVPLYGGDGTVRIWIGERDYSGPSLASDELVAQVQAAIDSVKPVTAHVTVAAPTLQPVDIALTLVPETAGVQDAVAAELAQLFARDAAPEGLILISRINESVSIALGESDHTLVSPAGNVQADVGAILTLGEVTFA